MPVARTGVVANHGAARRLKLCTARANRGDRRPRRRRASLELDALFCSASNREAPLGLQKDPLGPVEIYQCEMRNMDVG